MPGRMPARLLERLPGRPGLLLLLIAPALLLVQPVAAHAAPAASEAVRSAAVSTTAARTRKLPRYVRALRVAEHKVGDPYQYGAAGPNRFDCSGLVYFSTHRVGYKRVPRTAAEQAHFMRHIPRRHMRRGDYVFFTGSGGVYHVGIFIGRRHGRVYILHAPEPGTRVRRERVWTNQWFPGTLRRR